MNYNFNGERLKQARIYRGMTVAELAEQINSQRQTLSMYEIAKSQPADRTTVEKIAKALRFPVSFFFDKQVVQERGTVYFRALLTTSKKYRTEQIVKMSFLSQIYDFLKDYIIFPEFETIILPDNCSPEDAAARLRRQWRLGLGPIDNLVTIVEQNGILCTTFNTSTDDVDAFSQLVDTEEETRYIIAYSSNKTSAARVHFDIAHELGHIFLHEWSDDIEIIPKDDFKERERQANEFAAAFLLPKETFKKDALAGPKTIPYYKQLKKKWKVSIAAMIRRARDLGVMTTEDYQNLIRTMQRRGQRKEEPLDDVLLTAQPAMLRTAVVMLLQEDVFMPKEFMHELSKNYGLSIYPEEVEYLLSLPTGILSSNLIDFTSLRIKANSTEINQC